MPIPESQRSTVPIRVRKDTMPGIREMQDRLRRQHDGGTWSKGDVVHIAVQWWLTTCGNR